MKQILDKRNYIILFIIIILSIFLIFQSSKKSEYVKSYNYFDHSIVVKLYENKDVFDDIDKIYQKYEKLDNKLLSKVISYGKKAYQQTNGYVDISKGNFNDNFTTKINELNPKMTSDIDISFIISSLATAEVIKYLENNGIYQYLINDDGDITVGEHYQNKKYKLSINNTKKVLEIVSLENASMVTRGLNEGSYMLNPIEKKQTKKYDLVVVIDKDIKKANILANAIYLMDLDEGKKFIKDNKASALWYNGQIETVNFEKYIGEK